MTTNLPDGTTSGHAEVEPVHLDSARVAVLIPCYNEQATVAKVVRDYRAALPTAQVYVYDNNSTDRTAEIVADLEASDDRVHLRHEWRQGKGNVIHSMFRDIDADCYVMIDGDDTYPAEYAPQLVELVLTGRADMAIGDRLSTTYATQNKRPFHEMGNSVVRSLINHLFRCDITDIMTGYRAFSRTFVKGFPVLSRGFEIETEMSIHAVDKNLKVREVPIDYRDRPEGSASKLDTYSDGWKVLRTIFRLFKNYHPLAFFGIIGALFAIACAASFIPILVDYVRLGEVPRFPTLIVAVGLGMVAVLCWAVAVILDVEVAKSRQLYEVMTNYHDHIERLLSTSPSAARATLRRDAATVPGPDDTV
ncbi:glycosyltransferase family 2 protein [Acidipropionibacterium jensenii]|uniref:glycosyltransferase family 2 protein n=2 Tax=Acidipropionibacterium jensenii TaxID=1749 RepID=UPI002649EBF4|nr:glycosyltransferase family 2 protein [Acidipropionibacterium jensenii]MDN5976720.1 glycosyltransferase family 2 protein [Acidipropionibacterium jensenii]MDN5995129.1 glycosyltransferase family 2 protein [Acidipropionibacterium jensenii]MDN6426909.1 glycosyltransferase family 2 protein [Acidipropionibacterium jensenii]MDN6441071.1 glycosyltransferase family 2 protein [Acidipropionibacterium jensenii]MDN6479574.1 glycosyltransferase family 2 protein [Acidipropionibacterium jensenii]